MLRGKKIILGVCGSIAAYKAAFLIRLLIKEDAEVKVIMTTSASSFITPLTLSTLSKNPVFINLFDTQSGSWVNHIELGLWADLVLIAPASAHTIGKMANGICDNLLLSVYLSARCPVFICPAMDVDMFLHGSTKLNLEKLKTFGNYIVPPETGELASGLIGQGRMAEPENIIQVVAGFFSKNLSLKGKKILITAGPTYELLDPVRFIGNFSSGKMGYRIAEESVKRGGRVTLVSGPSYQPVPVSVDFVPVQTAEQMYNAVEARFDGSDIIIMAAAVADYTPKVKSREKIKKQDAVFTLELVKTKDIAAEMGKIKKKEQLLIGFALESEDIIANAKKKLERKNFDMIVLNSIRDKDATFGFETNKVTIIKRDGTIQDFELKEKSEVAFDILDAIESLL